MKKIISLLVTFLTIPFIANAQWTAKQNLGTNINIRTFASAVALNGNVYVVGGNVNFTGLDDVWEYSITGNSWTQKGNFPGGPRGGMTSFVIGSKAYFMCGSNYTNTFFSDVWEYDPAMDNWTQKGNFPGGVRHEAFGFVIGNKGYLGSGASEFFGPNSTTSATFNDFWEYDQSMDNWTQKTDVPGPTRGWGIGVALNGKGYAGLGGNATQTNSFNDFYEYDPATDAWAQLANYAFSATDAMAFTLGNDVYVCGGFNFAGTTASAQLKKYDPNFDTWSNQPSMPAGVTLGGAAVTVGNSVFLGTGYNSNFAEKNDWWQFAQLCQAPIAYATTTTAATGFPCNGKLVVSNITSGCGPYTYSVSANAGAIISGANGFTVNNLCPDTYTVYVKDDNCCGTSMTVVTIPSGIAQGIADAGISAENMFVFPNPNAGAFKISIDGNDNIKQQDIKILNILGQEVEATVLISANEINVIFNKHEKGIYFLQVKNNGKQVSKKIQVD